MGRLRKLFWGPRPASPAASAPSAPLPSNSGEQTPAAVPEQPPLVDDAQDDTEDKTTGGDGKTSGSLAIRTAAADDVSTGVRGRLWMEAYEIFQQKNADLAADYSKHIESQKVKDGDRINNAAEDATDVAPLKPDAMTKLVTDLVDARAGKQWKISVSNKSIIVRDQVQKLAKFLTWSNGIVKDALSSQPYAALAWSAVSILLPVCFATPPSFRLQKAKR